MRDSEDLDLIGRGDGREGRGHVVEQVAFRVMPYGQGAERETNPYRFQTRRRGDGALRLEQEGGVRGQGAVSCSRAVISDARLRMKRAIGLVQTNGPIDCANVA